MKGLMAGELTQPEVGGKFLLHEMSVLTTANSVLERLQSSLILIICSSSAPWKGFQLWLRMKHVGIPQEGPLSS